MERNTRTLSKMVHTLSKIGSLLLLIGAMFFGSCGEIHREGVASRHHIVVIHSWSDQGEEGKSFSDCMDKAFQLQGMDVDVHHIYANMVRRPSDVFSAFDWAGYADSIRQWKPEIILLNDDPIVEWALTMGYKDSLLTQTPIVFAGVNALLRDSLYHFPLMTGYVERIDLSRTIDMCMNLTQGQCVFVELDYSDSDNRLRHQLYDQISDSARFVNNGDFHLPTLNKAYLEENFPGIAVVNFISCATPNRNNPEGTSDSVAKVMTKHMYQRAPTTWHIQVKRDIFSNSLIDRSARPQFTCIREQFNNAAHPLFLCGYFTSMETQVEDQVQYAVRILRGEKPWSLPILQHASDYYMDWNAVQLASLRLSYETCSKQFKIINAPSYLANPVEFSVYVGIVVLLVTLLVYLILHFLTRWKRKDQVDLVSELEHENKVHDLLFSNAKDTLWTFNDGVFTFSQDFAKYFHLPTNQMTVQELQAATHPDSQASLSFMLNFQHQRGKKSVRLRLSPDGANWYWCEATYTATEETSRTGEIFGLLLNIDHKKETEEKLQEAQILASQVALKENFLANISHDLRTPLGAVTGFSSLLTMPGMTFEEGEREQYGEIIHQNTDMILNMIDSVMEKAQMDTSELEILQKPVSVHKLVGECYNTNRIIAPTHLKFILEEADPDTTVNIDLTRTKQVVNNFLSNAFKFTTEGSITLGWQYVEGTDQIEVYVRDTGIGVEPEKQAGLFERYIKVNETDRGTGLGLNISKSIIEKQGGTIGVESEFGKGSKFFFRLSQFVQCLLLVLTIGMGLLFPSSCTPGHFSEMKDAKVLVVHSYDKMYLPYRDFNDQLAQTFNKNDVSVSMRHLYLNQDDPAEGTVDLFLEMKDSLARTGWAPDVILTEGDRATYQFLMWNEMGVLDSLENVLVVCGSLHHPDWKLIRKHHNIVAIGDPIDYCANINLAVEMFGKNCVEIELDHFHQDSLIRQELRQAIARPPYLDGTDFHLDDIRDEKFSTIWKDSIVVLAFSTESPEHNSRDHYDRDAGYRNLRSIYLHSWLYPSVSLKKDMYSSFIVDKTGRPQFTAVKADFATGDGRYLCGYFADYQTVADDMARVASEVLKGADLASYVGMTHQKHYYMDYQAMQMLGLKYNDYKNRFIIKNAPIESTMPVVYYGTWLLIALVFLGAIFSILLILQAWKDRSSQKIINDVQRRAEMRELAIRGADTRSVRTEGNVKDIIAHIHPDRSGDIPLMMQALDIKGTHNYEIYADIEEDGIYRWWQLRFVVMIDKDEKRVDGILINIDETKQYEADLKKAMRLADEAKQKENFLTTISHEIRIPLNAVVGFCDVLVSMPAESFTPEELAEYSKIIKANNGSLSTMIEDILMFSRIESGRIQYVKDVFDAADLVRELSSEWSDIMPDGVQFLIVDSVHGVMVNNDRVRVKYILNQFVSNAVKFTKQGVIVLGATAHLNDRKVEFFVNDSGCGIPLKDQHRTFELFWKGNDFIPGLGLGLNVAQKLADGMGLTLGVESLEKFGSKFSLYADAEFTIHEEDDAEGTRG